MRKQLVIFSMLFTLALGGVFFPEKVLAEGADSCVDLACEWVEQYYRNMDLDETFDISCYFSEDILPLLEAKIEMGAFRRQTLGLQYRDYNITVLPISQEESNTETDMRLQVKREWYYNDNSDLSGITEVLEVSVVMDEDGECKITECYDEFESLIYGPVDELYQSMQTARENIDISSLLDAYISDYKEDCVEKGIQMAEDMQNNIQDDEIESREKTSLSRSEIKSWARDNFDQESPTSSDSSVPYYDFSQISGAYDCTNFVSHALLAGGATMQDNGKSGIQGTDQWYYRDTGNRSSSWTGVNQLYEFLTRSNPGDSNIGPYATEKEVTYANTFTGDIVQKHNGTTWRHSMVVTKFSNGQVYVIGRTSPNQNNNDVLVSEIIGELRLLHLEGNYE